MEKWILNINMIITKQGDNQPEIKEADIEASFNQLMKFQMDLGFESMEDCWEAAANIDGVTYVLRPNITISSRCERVK